MNTDAKYPTEAWFIPLHEKALEPASSGTATGAGRITVYVDDVLQSVPADISVAAAMLMTGTQVFSKRPVCGSARAPYCMMGVCFECVVDIDDRTAQRGCMTRVATQMRIRTRSVASRLPMSLRDQVAGQSSMLVVDAAPPNVEGSNA